MLNFVTRSIWLTPMIKLIEKLIISLINVSLKLMGIRQIKYRAVLDKRLISHIENHRNDNVKALLNENIINGYDVDGTLLHRAVNANNREIINHLIELGSNVNSKDDDGDTPLMLAVRHNRLECVEVLLEAEADVDRVVNNNRKSALRIMYDSVYLHPKLIEAIHTRIEREMSNLKEFIDKLVKAGCTMYHAVYLNDVDVLKFMLTRGFDVNSKDSRKLTALHATAELGYLAVAKWLVENGADVDALDEFGKSPVYLAAGNGQKNVLRFLLEHGANPNTKHRLLGQTPLFAAVECWNGTENQYTYCIELLLKYGAVIWNPDDNRLTIFDFALHHRRFQIINVLIGHLAVRGKLVACDFKSAMKCRWYRNSFQWLELNYDLCWQMLGVVVFEKMTLLDLLMKSKSNMTLLVRNETFVSKVLEFCSEYKLSELCSYYHLTLMKSMYRAELIVELENTAMTVINYLFGWNYNQYYIAARRVIYYLDESDLERLSQFEDNHAL